MAYTKQETYEEISNSDMKLVSRIGLILVAIIVLALFSNNAFATNFTDISGTKTSFENGTLTSNPDWNFTIASGTASISTTYWMQGVKSMKVDSSGQFTAPVADDSNYLYYWINPSSVSSKYMTIIMQNSVPANLWYVGINSGTWQYGSTNLPNIYAPPVNGRWYLIKAAYKNGDTKLNVWIYDANGFIVANGLNLTTGVTAGTKAKIDIFANDTNGFYDAIAYTDTNYDALSFPLGPLPEQPEQVKLDLNVVKAYNLGYATTWSLDCNDNTFDLSNVDTVTSLTAQIHTTVSCDLTKTGYVTQSSIILNFDANVTKTYYLNDTTAPTTATTSGSDTWLTANRAVSITSTDAGSGLKIIYLTDSNGTTLASTTSPLNTTIGTDGNHSLTYTSQDNNGNWDTNKIAYVPLDKTNPSTTGTGNKDTWQTTNQTIYITATDATSGVKKIYIRDSNGTIIYSDSPFNGTIATDGNHQITYTSYDNAGNWDTNKIMYIPLDKTGPVLGTTYPVSFTTYLTFIKGTGTILVTATDATSGISTCEYSIDNGSNWLAADKNSTHCYKNLTISDQNYIFKIRATDIAGTTTTGAATSTYVGDSNAPFTSTTFSQSGSDQNITFYCTDFDRSGCKSINYNIDSGGWITLTNTPIFGNGDFELLTSANFYNSGRDVNWDGYFAGNGTSAETLQRSTTQKRTGTYSLKFNCVTSDFAAEACAITAVSSSPAVTIDSNFTFYMKGTSPQLLIGYVDDANSFTQVLQQDTVNNADWNSYSLIIPIGKRLAIKGNEGKNSSFTFYIDDVNNNTPISINGYSILYSGTGLHNLKYYSVDNLDNNETTHDINFITYGNIHLAMFDESDGTSFTGNIRYNGIDYNSVSSLDQNLQSITPGLQTIMFSYPGYGTRTYTIDLNQYSDVNIEMLMLATTLGANIQFLVFHTDELTPYINAKVLISKPQYGGPNISIGNYYTDASGYMTVFTSLTDQNYTFSINDGNDVYQLVALTIKKPIDEESNLVIDGNYTIKVSGAGLQDFNNVASDKVIYLLPNTIPSYTIKIQDVNHNYFERTYFKSYRGNPLTDTLQPYLVSNSTGFLTTLNALDATTNNPIGGITFKIYKNLALTGRTLIEQVVTDDKGQALVLLLLNNQYEFEAYYGTTLLETFNITATSSTIHFILDLGTTPVTPITQKIFNSTFTPTGTLTLNSIGVITFTQTLINSGLDSISITSTLTQNGANLLGSPQTYTGSSGHTFTYNVNWSAIVAGTITSQMTLTDSDGNTYVFTRNYLVVESYGATGSDGNAYSPIWGLQHGLKIDCGCADDPITPCYPLLIVAIFISIALVVVASIKMDIQSGQASGIIFLVSMILFTFLTWVPIWLTAGIIIIALSFIIGERR